MIRHVDLFSGIGGFILAAMQVWKEEYELVLACEIEEFPQKVLRKNFGEDILIINDIHDLKGNGFGTIDLLTGGFPCQPFSTAGKREGREDDRALFPEMLRVIREAKPRWIVAENVYGIISQENGDYFEEVCASLEGEGYKVQPFIIPASAVNAPHRRNRVWIVANSNGSRSLERKFKKYAAKKEFKTQSRPSECAKSSADSDKFNGNNGGFSASKISQFEASGIQWAENWYEAAARFCRVDDGITDRVDRLKSLGNAIVPQVAVKIFEAIKEFES